MSAILSKLDANQVLKTVLDEPSGSLKVAVVSSFAPSNYDEISLGYSGSDLTSVIYKLSGSTLVTLALTYNSGNLVNVLKS